jgi:hypothetical protein
MQWGRQGVQAIDSLVFLPQKSPFMKSFPLSLSLATVLLVSLAFLPARAQFDAQPPPPGPDQGAYQQGPPPDQGPGGGGDQDASYQTFYDQLGNDGTWIQTDDYGYVFQPNVDDPNWAPYTDGQWVYTEDGWTWVSDEPWGWATYHYGRWAFIDGTGWIWVPGDQWAPAWVSWRFGGGYVGWAPLPPETLYGGVSVGFHFGNDVDNRYHIGAGHYHFVREGNLGAANLRGEIVNRNSNFSLINRTTNITNINVSAGHSGFSGVSVGGPSLAAVNAHATHRVQTMHLAAGGAPGQASIHGNSLSIFAPRVNAATAHQDRPSSVSRTLSHPTFSTGKTAKSPFTMPTHVSSNAAVDRSSSANTGEAFHPQNTPVTHTESANTGEPFHSTYQPAQTHVTEPANTGQAYHPTYQPAETHVNEPANTGQSFQPFHQTAQPTETHVTEPTHTDQTFHQSFEPQSSQEHSEPAHTDTHTFTPQVQHSSGPAPQQHSAPSQPHSQPSNNNGNKNSNNNNQPGGH